MRNRFSFMNAISLAFSCITTWLSRKIIERCFVSSLFKVEKFREFLIEFNSHGKFNQHFERFRIDPNLPQPKLWKDASKGSGNRRL